MKVVAVCALLLVTITLASGDGGAISVFNNGSAYSPQLTVTYRVKGGFTKTHVSPNIYIRRTETSIIPEEAESFCFSVNFQEDETPSHQLMEFQANKLLKMCFKTSGTVNDPQIGQIDCNSKREYSDALSDGGAISLTNNANYRSGIIINYALNHFKSENRQHKEVQINPEETKTIEIPKGAKRINVAFDKPQGKPVVFDAFSCHPVKLCFKIWGTADATQSAQVDC